MLSHEMSETKCGFFIFFTFKSISNHGALIVKEKRKSYLLAAWLMNKKSCRGRFTSPYPSLNYKAQKHEKPWQLKYFYTTSCHLFKPTYFLWKSPSEQNNFFELGQGDQLPERSDKSPCFLLEYWPRQTLLKCPPRQFVASDQGRCIRCLRSKLMLAGGCINNKTDCLSQRRELKRGDRMPPVFKRSWISYIGRFH